MLFPSRRDVHADPVALSAIRSTCRAWRQSFAGLFDGALEVRDRRTAEPCAAFSACTALTLSAAGELQDTVRQVIERLPHLRRLHLEFLRWTWSDELLSSRSALCADVVEVYMQLLYVGGMDANCPDGADPRLYDVPCRLAAAETQPALSFTHLAALQVTMMHHMCSARLSVCYGHSGPCAPAPARRCWTWSSGAARSCTAAALPDFPR